MSRVFFRNLTRMRWGVMKNANHQDMVTSVRLRRLFYPSVVDNIILLRLTNKFHTSSMFIIMLPCNRMDELKHVISKDSDIVYQHDHVKSIPTQCICKVFTSPSLILNKKLAIVPVPVPDVQQQRCTTLLTGGQSTTSLLLSIPLLLLHDA